MKPAGVLARIRVPALAALLALATLVAYWGVWDHQFLGLDDNEYVTQNPRIGTGLSAANVVWALTTGRAGNWHPLTWLSHLLDGQIAGLDPAWPHLENLLIHLASTLILFRVLARTTGAAGRSAFVAAVFALHPLHVESVAWAAERKDVLSGLFAVLTLGAYARWARSPGAGRYAAMILLFALGLAAKPMLVTLPFVLLLLDLWPLRRIESPGDAAAWLRLAREKLPLFVLAFASCAITWLAQRQRGAMSFGDRVALGARLANAVVSYAAYLVDAVWPAGLSVFYPHPGTGPPVWEVAGAALLLAAGTALAWRARRSRPYLLVGWLWYLGMLVPVIGIVQVGAQARADRYTYLPLVGIAIAVAWGAWGAVDLAARSRGARAARASLAALAFVAAASWTVLTRIQVGWWRDDETLFGREVRLVPESYVARGILGDVRLRAGKLDEAIEMYRAALASRPGYAQGHSNYGMALELQGRKAEAFAEYEAAVRCEGSLAEPRHNLARLLAEQGRRKQAVEQYETVLSANPDFAESHLNLGLLLIEAGSVEEGAWHLERAIHLKPGLDAARKTLEAVRTSRGARSPRGPPGLPP